MEEEPGSPEGSGWHLLLHSDDPGATALVQEALAAGGTIADLRIVATATAAAAVLAEERPDAVVHDATATGEPGLAAVAELDAIAPDVPIVVLVDPEDDGRLAAAAMRRGASDVHVTAPGSGPSLARTLHSTIEQQRLVRLVTTGARQRQALARVEEQGHAAGTVAALLDIVIVEVATAVPRVDVCVRVATSDGEISRGGTPESTTGSASVWPFSSTVGDGELAACAPPPEPLTTHERTFFTRLAQMTAVALDALAASSDLQLRARQLEMLYDLSRALQTCTAVDEVLAITPDALLPAIQPTGRSRVELTIEGRTAAAGASIIDPRSEQRADIEVDGVVAGSLVVAHLDEVHSAVQPVLVGQVAELVEDWLTRRRVQQERDDQQDWIQLLLDQLPAVIWTVDAELRFTSLTGSGLEAIDPPPRLGQTLVEHFGGDSDHLSARHHREALTGTASTYTLSWLDRDWEVAVTPLHDRHGTVVGATGVGLDVTDRQAALRRAERERRRYQALFEHSLDGIVLTDEAGRFTAVNPAMCELVGRSEEELLGLHTIDLVDTEVAAAQVQSLQEEIDEGGTQRGTLPLARPDGTTVEVEFHTTADILEGTHLATVRDVTDQRRFQRELQASESRFRTLAEQAVEGIFRISLVPERTYEYSNPALARLTGYDHDDLVGDDLLLRRRTHPEDVIDDTDAGAHTLRFQRADGTWRWLEVQQAHITDAAGAVVALQGLVIDVTDQKRHADALEAALVREQQAAEDLRRLDELKNTFLRAASHELRTPLSAIYGISATLHMLRERLDAETIDHLWTRLDFNVERLRVLLDDLLDINRLTSSEVNPQLEQVDLAEVAQRVADEVPMGHRSLRLALEPTPATVEPSKVERILHNLLANAVKHTPEATTVTVQTHPGTDGAAVLVVADDGPGIDPEIRDRLFEPFVQGSTSATSPSPGTGIGLSLVRQFVELHGGTVSVDDSSAGGTRFEAVFPLHPGV